MFCSVSETRKRMLIVSILMQILIYKDWIQKKSFLYNLVLNDVKLFRYKTKREVVFFSLFLVFHFVSFHITSGNSIFSPRFSSISARAQQNPYHY